MRKQTTFFLAAVILGMTACAPKKENTGKYPFTTTVDSVDTYFGEKVPDPYRWLENDTTKETADWVKRENDVTFAYLKNIPYRDKIKIRLEAIYNYERLSAPFKEGG
ncbi:MAG TPA: hypothetical protein VK517_01500, partial [Cyclobacteriaceae bacterium]|nr:hypothetical protein [Cyclobacteriaceae bacterium]